MIKEWLRKWRAAEAADEPEDALRPPEPRPRPPRRVDPDLITTIEARQGPAKRHRG